MTTRTLAEVLESVRALLEAKTVECVYGADGKQENQYGDRVWCGRCDGKGHYFNPALAPLLALVSYVPPLLQEEGCTCGTCRESDFEARLRYWETALDGALEGALIKALGRMKQEHHPDSQDFATLARTRFKLLHLLMETGDTRLAACEAVEAWLKEAKP